MKSYGRLRGLARMGKIIAHGAGFVLQGAVASVIMHLRQSGVNSDGFDKKKTGRGTAGGRQR